MNIEVISKATHAAHQRARLVAYARRITEVAGKKKTKNKKEEPPWTN